MPTELEELVGFIASPNPKIRQIALDNLLPYSLELPAIFKTDGLLPVKNLRTAATDHPKIAEPALTILINLSGDRKVVECLASDDKFLQFIFASIVKSDEPNANLLAMLLANLAKWDGFKDILGRRQKPPAALASDESVMNQLVDLFVKGADGSYNRRADYDHLAYLFADLAKHAEVRQYFASRQSYDDAIPLTKLKVFTEHKSDVRRRGVASAIKNIAFDISVHPSFLDEDEMNVLPYILLPIIGNEDYDEDEMLGMLPDLQLLPADKRRDPDNMIIQTHVETLTLLTTTRPGRDHLRKVNVYPVIRETHARVDDDGVREACERLVQVLMRDEAPENGEAESVSKAVEEESDDDDKIVEV